MQGIAAKISAIGQMFYIRDHNLTDKFHAMVFVIARSS
jgi:hypothetical protein